MRTEDLRLLILKTFKEKEFYGYDIQKKLISEGSNIDIGRLYIVLNQMLREGFLESTWEKSDKGPKKKLYKIVAKGRQELNKIQLTAVQTIHKAYGEYLLNLPPEKSVFNIISKEIIDQGKGKRVVLVTESSSAMYERLLRSIQDKLDDSRIFIIKPKKVSLKLELDNIVNLDGNLENIPLKDNYADLLLTTNMPRNENVKKATREWQRVVKKTGKIAVLAPNVLFASIQDPLTIGDYMERWEHETYENRKVGEGDILLKSLRERFSNVKEKNIVHMKLILADNPQKTSNDK